MAVEWGEAMNPRLVLTPRDLIPVTLKPQRNNDITPSFQDRESKHCSARPSHCVRTHTQTLAHTLAPNYLTPLWMCVCARDYSPPWKPEKKWVEHLISRTRFNFQASMATNSFMLDLLLKAHPVKRIFSRRGRHVNWHDLSLQTPYNFVSLPMFPQLIP